MMNLTSILLSTALTVADVFAQQNHPGSRGNLTNTTNTTVSPGYSNELATLNRQVEWFPVDEDQEICAYGEAKTVGEKLILKSDCQKIANHLSSLSGYWRVTGYGRGDAYATLTYKGTCSLEAVRVDDQDSYFDFGNTDVKYFVEQAMRLSSDPSRMPTVIGSVHCAGENSPLVEWKVGLPPSGASPTVRTSVWGGVAVALVAIVVA